MLLRLLTNENFAKGAHALTGVAGTAGMVYGIKRLIDHLADKRVRQLRGEGLGPPGYQHTPAHLLNKGVERYTKPLYDKPIGPVYPDKLYDKPIGPAYSVYPASMLEGLRRSAESEGATKIVRPGKTKVKFLH